MINIKQCCTELNWTPMDLSRKAEINYRTALRAYHGEPIKIQSRDSIAKALSLALGQNIEPSALETKTRYRGKTKPKGMQTVA